jgi:Zn-dependent protease
LLIRLGVALNIFYAPDSIVFSHVTAATNPGIFSSIASLLSIFFSLNLILFVFNLLPFPPLDGSGAIPLLMENRTAQSYLDFIHSNPSLMFIGLFVAWNFFDAIFDPIHLFSINLLYPGMGYH